MAGRSWVIAAGSWEKDPGWRDTALAGRWTRTAALNQQDLPLQQGANVTEMRYWWQPAVSQSYSWHQDLKSRHLCRIIQGRREVDFTKVRTGERLKNSKNKWNQNKNHPFHQKGYRKLGNLEQNSLNSFPLCKSELPDKVMPLCMQSNVLI